jgi:(2Fe-2S) ferredoxin
LLDGLRQGVAANGLRGKVRVTSAGCLDLCARGCAVAVFSADPSTPETWYSNLTPADAEAIVRDHLVGNTPVAALVDAVANTPRAV